MPTEKDKAIEDYFSSDLCLESYEINTDTVLESPPIDQEA